MFGKLFKRKKLSEPVSIRSLKTDMHSHLIPGIDDGSPNMKTSLNLIKEMKMLGYEKLITTPHIGSDIYKNTTEIIQEGLKRVQQKLSEHRIDITLEASAEYLIDDGFEALLKNDMIRTFSKNYVLVELPYFHVPPNLFEVTFEMQIKGYKIMLAHPERYLYWYNNMKKFEELKNRGVYFQLNMVSLTGHYSAEVKKMAEKLIDADMIDFLGSDLHNFNYLELLKRSRFEPYLEKVLENGSIKNHLL